ncbi:MAG: hypothetical protein AAGN66_14690 [Acidobacteriota bacterium]
MKLLTPLIACSLLTGCMLSLKSPIPSSGPNDLHLPLLGEWQVVELMGDPPDEPANALVALDDEQNLTLNLSPKPFSSARVFHLVEVGGSLFAFAEDPDLGRWQVAKLTLDSAESNLTIEGLNSDRIRADIGSGSLAGELVDFDDFLTIGNIEADATQLAAYLTSNPDAFVEVAKLQKVN